MSTENSPKAPRIVYVVERFIPYEGGSIERIFRKESKARKYAQKRQNESGFAEYEARAVTLY